MENCKMSGKKSGKSQEILRWMISGNPDELLCLLFYFMFFFFFIKIATKGDWVDFQGK